MSHLQHVRQVYMSETVHML